MRTKIYNKLTNNEIEEYLKSRDIIFLPVGVTEMHGALPVDCETVLAQAIALKLADKCNGLVLSDLSFFYAGATVLGRATLEVSVRSGIDYLYQIMKSLKRQGFGKFVFITFHAPAYLTVSPVLRDFYDETHLPILYIDAFKIMMQLLNDREFAEKAGILDKAQMNDLFFVAYDILGRLEDIPLTTSEILDCSVGTNSTNCFSDLMKLGPISGTFGFYSGQKQDHAPTPVVTSEVERARHAELGKVLMDTLVDWIDINQKIELMKMSVPFYEEIFRNSDGQFDFN